MNILHRPPVDIVPLHGGVLPAIAARNADAGTANAGGHRIAPLLQQLGHPGAGAVLFEGQLGVLVQVVADRDGVGVARCNGRQPSPGPACRHRRTADP